MANKTTDLNPERSEKFRYLDKFSYLPKLIILVCITMIAAVISWFRAESAIDEANKAQATAAIWQQMYKETERECRLAQIEVDDFRIALIRAGIELEHGEKP